MTNRRGRNSGTGNRGGNRGGSNTTTKGKDYCKNLNLVKTTAPTLPTVNGIGKSNVLTAKQVKDEEEILNKEKEEQIIELRRHLKKINLELKEIPKDGACLFRAISEQILFTQEKHSFVRNECVKYLHENEESFSPFVCAEDGADYATYLFELSQPFTWGGQLELQALSLMYQRNFLIYSSHTTPNLLYIPNLKKEEEELIDEENNRKYNVNISSFSIENGFEKTIMLLFSNGNHYDCLYSNSDFEKLQFCQSIIYKTIVQSIAIVADKELDAADLKLIDEFQNVGLKVWKKCSTEQTKKDLTLAKELNLNPYLVPLHKKEDLLEEEFQSVKGKNAKKKKKKAQNQVIGIEIEVNLKPRDYDETKENQQKRQPKKQNKVLIEEEGMEFPTLFGKKEINTPKPENSPSETPPAEEENQTPPKTWGAKKDWGSLLQPQN